jgi:hypothetical protein
VSWGPILRIYTTLNRGPGHALLSAGRQRSMAGRVRCKTWLCWSIIPLLLVSAQDFAESVRGTTQRPETTWPRPPRTCFFTE